MLYSHQNKGSLWLPCVLLVLLAFGFSGCGREDVRSYRIAKPQQAQAAPGGAMQDPHAGHGHGVQAAAPTLKYTVPKGWEEVAPGQMRAASFRLKEGEKVADVGVFPLPGMAGSDLSNVNRWRGQVGLAPLSEEELGKTVEVVEIAGAKGQLYDLAGEEPGSGNKSRILAAILRREGIAWFFKMTGEDSLAASQKPAFLEFLKSVQFVEAAANELPPSHPPIEGVAAAGGAMPGASSAPASTSEKPAWQVPKSWQEAPAGQFLVAKYTVKSDAGEASINVSMSAGEGGGVAANVNRWRGQLGLSVVPADQLKLQELETAGGKATVAELSGTDARTNQKTRLIGAVVPQKDRTWFYKLMGNETTVEREKDAFIEFIKTTKY